MSPLILLLIVMLIVFACAIIWLLVIVFGDKRKPQNATIGFNFLANYGEGRAVIMEKSVEKGKGGRLVITGTPADLDFNKFKTTDVISDVNVIVDNNKHEVFPVGTASKDRSIAFYLPSKPADLHPLFRRTAIGAGLMYAAKLKDYENLVEEILREGGERKDALLKEIGTGEISQAFMDIIRETALDTIKSIVEAKSAKDKPTTLIPASNLGHS